MASTFLKACPVNVAICDDPFGDRIELIEPHAR
jgi:hypothetical protein